MPRKPEACPANAARALCCALFLLCQVLPGQGAFAQDGRWFRVELLVFAQPGGFGAEQWPPEPDLAYPDNARFLVDPERVARDNRSQGMEGALDARGRLVFAPADTDIPLPGGTPGPGGAAEPGGPASPPEGAPPATEEHLPAPAPFRLLPRGQLEFRGKAAYMERHGGYRVLFHDTWVQPVRDERRALPIVLDHSGDERRWPELQGTVRLHLSRYLHLETNLWLNTGGEYLPGVWRMPAPPLGPRSVIVQTVQAPPVAPQPGAEPASGESVGGASTAAADAELAPVYPWRHAIVHRQQRRMRSNEVHYLDHPVIGVIAKLTPLSEEDLLALAQEE